jgi:molybdate transport system substrate-binding protein
MVPRAPLVLTLIAALLMLLSGCGGDSGSQVEGPTVLAASSLQEALTEVGEAWAQQGHARPRLAFAASSALARQIQGGAPADVYLSADEEWMNRVAEEGLLEEGSRTDLLTNELVLVAPQSASTNDRVRGLDALSSGRVALADPDAVPAGRYARASLESLGVWDDVAGRVVPAENVRAALVLVERGEVPLGIVYATDAQASRSVSVVYRFPAGSHPPIRYPVAQLAASEHPDTRVFQAFLASPEAQRIFVRHGFGIVQGAGR